MWRSARQPGRSNRRRDARHREPRGFFRPPRPRSPPRRRGSRCCGRVRQAPSRWAVPPARTASASPRRPAPSTASRSPAPSPAGRCRSRRRVATPTSRSLSPPRGRRACGSTRAARPPRRSATGTPGNYIRADAAASGGPPRFIAQGSDANIALSSRPRALPMSKHIALPPADLHRRDAALGGDLRALPDLRLGRDGEQALRGQRRDILALAGRRGGELNATQAKDTQP